MNNVSVEKNQNESASSTLRRFTKRTQESGVLMRVRGIRYNQRVLSHYKNKMATLEKLENAAKREVLSKLGKLPPLKGRGMRKPAPTSTSTANSAPKTL